jgi:hypothetical protein
MKPSLNPRNKTMWIRIRLSLAIIGLIVFYTFIHEYAYRRFHIIDKNQQSPEMREVSDSGAVKTLPKK